MSIPFFYYPGKLANEGNVVLNEETSRHIVQVLRMKPGELVNISDGKGSICTTEIIKDHKKSTEVKILSIKTTDPPQPETAVAISLVKNTSRFEWFLEKATELGITRIIPLISSRTEKQHFRQDRMQNILVSAMLQSQQSWLPQMDAPRSFNDVVKDSTYSVKMIAHCEEGRKSSFQDLIEKNSSAIILIGPEGDFTPEEIKEALAHEYHPVMLGHTRLRTETAGIAAAVLLKLA